MKRLLRISLDSAIISVIPILSWVFLGLLVDSNLSNIFSLTYPIQFILTLLRSIFGVGANIHSVKTKDNNHVLSGMTIGIVVGFIIFGLIALNIDSYIIFMNMDVNIYKEFAIYSVIQLYIGLIFFLVLEKLYYEEKNKLANKYCLTFNSLNFVVLIFSSIIFANKILIVATTILTIFTYVLCITIKQYKKFKLRYNILVYLKYVSTDVVNNIFFFLIFLFGLSNALEYGKEYMIALNFVALITDCQWDALDAISTVAQIDISKSNFNYKEHRKNAYKLLLILLSTTMILFLIFFKFYDLKIDLFLIYLFFELVNFVIYPIYRIKTIFLQLEYSAIKITVNKILASSLRLFVSLLPTPFCTGLGQVCSSIYQFISIKLMFYKNYKIENNNIIKVK